MGAVEYHKGDMSEETFLRNILSKVTKDGERRGMKIAFRLVSTYRAPGICTENVTRACFVSYRGLVSPCVFRNMPAPENASPGEVSLHAPKTIIFGDINNESLSMIWACKAYETFRADHARGGSTPSCGDCPKLFNS